MGLELGFDSRVDYDFRLQGWFTPEFEVGITRWWVVEGVASFVNRGSGFDFAEWRGETRFVLFEAPRWPASLAVSAEYEAEERAAKHIAVERLVSARAILTRTFGGSLLVTGNLGRARRLVPIRGDGMVYAVGARFPENRPITAGVEWERNAVERETRYGPSVRILLPHRMSLRIGGLSGHHYRPYKFIARAILEADL